MGYKGYSRDSFGNIVVDNGGFDDSVKEGLSLFAVLAIGFAFGILCVMLSVYIKGRICHINAEKMGFDCDYSFLTGCKIRLENGHYVDIDKYRGGLY